MPAEHAEPSWSAVAREGDVSYRSSRGEARCYMDKITAWAYPPAVASAVRPVRRGKRPWMRTARGFSPSSPQRGLKSEATMDCHFYHQPIVI